MSSDNLGLVSVVIPVYDIEECLRGCVESVLKQSYSNLEIILVDDGSTDRSGEICDDFAAMDKRVKVIHQKNQGLSGARNSGIRCVSGEFLVLVDGDDRVEKKFVEKLVAAAEKNGADIAICGFKVVGETEEDRGGESFDAVMTGEEATIRLLSGQENLEIVAWNKIYRKELFSGIEYPVGEKHEDNLTTYKLLSRAKRVVYIQDKLYDYVVRSESIMGAGDLKLRLSKREQAAKEAMVYFKDNLRLLEAAEAALVLAKFAWLDKIIAGEIKDKKKYESIVSELKKRCKKYSKNRFVGWKVKVYLRMIKMFSGVPYRVFRKIM